MTTEKLTAMLELIEDEKEQAAIAKFVSFLGDADSLGAGTLYAKDHPRTAFALRWNNLIEDQQAKTPSEVEFYTLAQIIKYIGQPLFAQKGKRLFVASVDGTSPRIFLEFVVDASSYTSLRTLATAHWSSGNGWVFQPGAVTAMADCFE